MSSVDKSSMISGLDKSPVAMLKPTHSRTNSTGSSRHSRQNSRDWEVMPDVPPDNHKPDQTPEMPGICEGFLLKKRKYPLQGWHKVTFQIINIIGKIHGSLEVSLAVMSINKKSRRIDLDAGDNIFHMKTKNHEMFYIWVTKLSAHRVYKKNEAMNHHQGVLQALSSGTNSLPAVASFAQRSMNMPSMLQSLGLASANFLYRFQCSDTEFSELSRCQLDLAELDRLIQRLHCLDGGLPITDKDLEHRISMQNLFLEKPKKKSGKIWGHSRTLSRIEALGMQYTPSHYASTSHLGASVQSIPDYVYSQLSTPPVTSPEGKKLHKDIYAMSMKVHTSLKTIHEVLSMERERVRQAWTGPDLRQSTSDQLATLCTTLSEVRSLRTAGSRCGMFFFHSHMRFRTIYLNVSVTESVAEYYDASEVLATESSSENEASDESGLSDITTSNSEPEETHSLKYQASVSSAHDVPNNVPKDTARRRTLPAHCADNSHIGILSILYNNIGKDLSRVSMPVALNEPLCFLQRLSEELEYSHLLDIANRIDDPYERMVYMAAFSISGYAWASWRNRYKPFNPVLGETYESIRNDRGFRFVSEQVSHHPPLSACHAESENFTFWQDQRWKNKFWGKSVEIVSSGMVNVTLPRYGDHYEWNKAVTCIHNVFSQQRWLEHYGDVIIRNTKSDVCTCKMTFVKSRYWGSDTSKNEVQGVVLNATGEVVHRFGGSWHEGIFCDTLSTPQCLWKPNGQPEDHFLYYGFSDYARELNELTPELQAILPPTDTRFRPDQRLLEEGKVDESDRRKDEVEEKQRDRRKELAKKGEEHVPRFFYKSLDEAGREVWAYNGAYWKTRENPGFANTKNLDLW
uniref:Oxysterol-binding protein n=1 Tax=Denticeps clupeoides TaxID=299321 RepID=A0AAY4CW61_9TELE